MQALLKVLNFVMWYMLSTQLIHGKWQRYVTSIETPFSRNKNKNHVLYSYSYFKQLILRNLLHRGLVMQCTVQMSWYFVVQHKQTVPTHALNLECLSWRENPRENHLSLASHWRDLLRKTKFNTVTYLLADMF